MDVIRKELKIGLLVVGILFLTGYRVFSQHTIIPTGTSAKILEIRKTGHQVVLNGDYNFFAKCSGDCDEVIPLQAPGPFNYYNRNLNLLDTNRFYVTSFTSSNFMHHAMISKTVDGGLSWNSILDTLSVEFYIAGLLVFDTNRIVLPILSQRTFVTNNGGDNWQIGAQHGMPSCGAALKVDDSTAVLGSHERFRFTTNKGDDWIGTTFLQASPVKFQMKSLDSIYSISIGPSGCYLSYTFGDPQTNRIDKLIPRIEPFGLYVVSKNEIYITGKGWPQETGRIMKTTNLGNSWSYYDVPETVKLLDMVFLNDSMALIGGYNGKLIKWNKNSPMTEWELGVTEKSSGAISATTYPNPAASHQEIEIKTIPGEQIDIQLYDLQGRFFGLVYSGIAESEQEKISINLSHLDAGVYAYQLQVGDKSGQLRFVKQ